MEKQVITIKRKVLPYKCLVCNHTVDVSKAEPKTIETDKVIIHSFDYGHSHARTFQIIKGKEYLVEGYDR